MRWTGQRVGDDGVGGAPALPGMAGLLRSVRTPEFAGTVFHEVEARSALNHVPAPSAVPFRWTVNPYRGCSHACVYCLAGPTRVLLPDGRTCPIARLRAGDVVLGTETGEDGVRRYVPTRVLAHWSTEKPAYAVRLAGGTEIVTSGEHRFLTDAGWRHVSAGWCRSGRRPHLRPGSALLGPGVPGSPVARTPAYERGYLTGLVRADGPAFPSGRLPLEALGRAHHLLAGLREPDRAAGLVRGSEAASGPEWMSGPVPGTEGTDGPVRGPGAAAGGPVRGPGPAGRSRGDAAPSRPVPRGPGAVRPGPSRPPAPGRIQVRVEAGRIARVDTPVAPRPAPATPAPDLDAVTAWPRQAGEEWCAGFLAGVLDARGEVVRGELAAVHADEEVVGRIAGALHRLGFAFTVERRGGARVVRLAGGTGAAARLLATVRPAVTRSLDGGAVGGDPELRVASVRALGRTVAMYDITTGTGDFVAEGVVSHNCFARNTHTYLDLDAGRDFDSQIVVKVNVARVLERELRAPRWEREPVAMGTNTDPYQRAEGRYRLMPGVIRAFARSGTPFSVLTKGTVLARDLPELAAAAADVPVSLGVSIALLDRALQAGLEPGTPTPAARLDLVRRITDAGLPCGVMVAPVLPLLTDSDEALDALLGKIAAAGASGASVLALHLRPGTREWFLRWMERERPDLIEQYAQLYRRGAYVDPAYRRRLAARVVPLLRRHGLTDAEPVVRVPDTVVAAPPPDAEQLTLFVRT
jgi:DNA repair photolyase